MTENCDDYNGYKPSEDTKDFISKCGTRVYVNEEKMKENLKCYDEAHSKENCITEATREALEEYLEEYASGKSPILCKSNEESIVTCVDVQKSIYNCNREIDNFLECLDKTVAEIYNDECNR